MTIEQMAGRLGIEKDELAVLQAQEQARSLEGGYKHLRDYLGSQIWALQQNEWNTLLHSLSDARVNAETFEAVDKLQQMLATFIETLKAQEI